MCGILGGNKLEWKYEKALEVMKHRGPDGKRLVKFENIMMGFVRLSIIDLSENGMQPMMNSDGTVCITFNGEIYGYIKLRNELEKLGYNFKSTSDTEAILYAYCQWKDEFINHIEGMFAIAVYDKTEKKIKLFRDRAGIKPLFYYLKDGNFAYASELKAIIELMPDYKFKVDNTALYDFYNYLYIPDPKTIYDYVYKLEPASKLVFNVVTNKIDSIEKYWELNVNELEGSKGPDKEQEVILKELISEAIEKQMIADVTVGGFLSGGIDSSIIAYEAVKKKPDFQTFSIGFCDYDYNELPYVNSLERAFKIKTNKYYVKKGEFHSLYHNMREWFDEPYCDTSAYPTFVVSRETRKKCTVALSGDGGDEIFGGYYRYKKLYEFLTQNKNTSVDQDLDYLWSIYLYQPLFDRCELRKRLGIGNGYDDYWFYRKYYIKDLPPITRMQYMDFHTYLPCDVLTKTDRVSMSVSLETRVPLLDTKLVEYCFGLSQEERCPNYQLKGLVKQAYIKEIPSNILFRKKMGFGIPNSFFDYDKNPQTCIENEIFEDLHIDAVHSESAQDRVLAI
jgi:asparagine synthase (glutamine-hydrolysing)